MAEMMRLRHARYRPEDLQVYSAVPPSSVFDVHPKAGVGGIWNNAFKVMSAIPVLGVIVIRIVEVFTVSQSIVLTVCFAVIGAMLGGIFPAVMYLFRTAMNWMSNSEREEGDGTESAPQQEQTGHFASIQVECASRCMNEDVIHFTRSPGSCRSSNRYVGWSLVVAIIVILLEWIICAAHRRLRSQSHPARADNDTSPEEIPV